MLIVCHAEFTCPSVAFREGGFQHLILGNQILKPVRQAQGKRVQDDDYLSKGSDITTSFAVVILSVAKNLLRMQD